jgi:hypothetical protein
MSLIRTPWQLTNQVTVIEIQGSWGGGRLDLDTSSSDLLDPASFSGTARWLQPKPMQLAPTSRRKDLVL